MDYVGRRVNSKKQIADTTCTCLVSDPPLKTWTFFKYIHTHTAPSHDVMCFVCSVSVSRLLLQKFPIIDCTGQSLKAFQTDEISRNGNI